MSMPSRREEHRALSFVLAVAMHGLIAAMLYIGMQWQTRPAAPVEVELWAGQLEASLPSEPSSKPIKPVVVPPKAEPEPEPMPTPPSKPDIVEEKSKTKPQAEKPKPAPKPEPAKKPEVAPGKLLAQIEAGQARQESKTAGKLNSKPLDASVALNALEKRQQAAEASAAAEEFKAYLALVRNKIRRNMTYPDDGASNPEAEFEVRLLPDMSVLEAKLLRSSGNAAFDEAARRAILRAGEYPPLPSGVEFRTLRQHKLKFRLNE